MHFVNEKPSWLYVALRYTYEWCNWILLWCCTICKGFPNPSLILGSLNLNRLRMFKDLSRVFFFSFAVVVQIQIMLLTVLVNSGAIFFCFQQSFALLVSAFISELYCTSKGAFPSNPCHRQTGCKETPSCFTSVQFGCGWWIVMCIILRDFITVIDISVNIYMVQYKTLEYGMRTC